MTSEGTLSGSQLALSKQIATLEHIEQLSELRLKGRGHGRSRGLRLFPIGFPQKGSLHFVVASPRRLPDNAAIMVGRVGAGLVEPARISRKAGKHDIMGVPNYLYYLDFDGGERALSSYRAMWEPNQTIHSEIDAMMKSLENLAQ